MSERASVRESMNLSFFQNIIERTTILKLKYIYRLALELNSSDE